jgi:sulfonate transport system permease protein
MTYIALGVLVPVLFFVWWELAARTGAIDARIFPAPTTIVLEAWELIQAGTLGTAVFETVWRLLLGFAIGAVIGFCLGVFMGLLKPLRAALEPSLDALYAIPNLTLLPIFIALFGFGDAPLVALIALAVFFYVWIGSMTSIIRVPAGYIEAARSIGVSPFSMFTHVYFPAILPTVMVNARVGMVVAITMAVAGEYIIGGTGLGYLIFNSAQLFVNGWMYAGIIVVGVIGVILAGLVSLVGRWVIPWERPRG